MHGNRTWWVAAILSMIGDGVTTWYGLTFLGGTIVESNPIMAGVIEAIGLLPALVGIKLVLLGFMLLAHRALSAERGWYAPAIVAIMYTFVTLFNMTQIATASGL